MKKVLLIDNYDSFTFNIAQLLDESNLCNFDIVKNDCIKIDEISEYDKILISPGFGLPKDAGNLMQIIENWHTKKSILGICLGMQAIAEYFGAGLYNLESVYHGIRTKIKIIDKTEILFDTLPEKFDAGLYHSWAVYNNIGNELKITAVSENNIIMGITHKKYDIKGIQFHPESYMTEHGKVIIENWLNYE
ncbi:MAG: aminodeoxychorismate/anthranilate synthase component II [Bacteroidales bacterium]|nr:aminodeoxychorismate/anthranilate synthase component II [Bacteroidales bacterium]